MQILYLDKVNNVFLCKMSRERPGRIPKMSREKPGRIPKIPEK